MHDIPRYSISDTAYTTWDRWQEAEKRYDDLKALYEDLRQHCIDNNIVIITAKQTLGAINDR